MNYNLFQEMQERGGSSPLCLMRPERPAAQTRQKTQGQWFSQTRPPWTSAEHSQPELSHVLHRRICEG